MGQIIRFNDLPDGSTNITNDDIIVIMDDPSGQKITKKLSLSQLKEFIGSTGGGNIVSVNGKTGVVALNKNDIGLGNVDNTSDSAKPISNATQTALNLKAPINNPSFTGSVSGITKNMVGLGNVDNTSDENKPISTATQSALNNKENTVAPGTTSHYYRGDKTWQTLDKSTVGLGNVDNTSDIDKPISNATQTALNLKADISNNLVNPGNPGGRLTLVSNNPVLLASSGTPSYIGSTLYYTPYNGNSISLYDTSNNKWKIYFFNELSLSLTGLSANSNFDIFLYDNNSILTLYAMQWTSNNVRGGTTWNTTRQDSIILSGDTGHPVSNKAARYLGTIRTTLSGTTEDSRSRQFVWNMNNQVNKRLDCSATGAHTYSTNTYRAFNNNINVGQGRAEFIIGQNSGQNTNNNMAIVSIYGNATNGIMSLGLDSSSSADFGITLQSTTNITSGSSTVVPFSTTWSKMTEGYHYVQLVESAPINATGTFYNLACSIQFSG